MRSNKKFIWWKYQCDCGAKIIVASYNILNNKTKSCGCLRKDFRKIGHGEAALNALIKNYKRGAKDRNLSWFLTKEQAQKLFQGSCVYCGQTPTQIMKTKSNTGNFIYNGIDRVDSLKGYFLNNCVSCCKTCNLAKNNMSKLKFLNWISRAYNYQQNLLQDYCI